jgi:serine protease Do
LRMKAPIFASSQVLSKAMPFAAKSGSMEETQSQLGIQSQNLTQELAKLLESQQQKGVVITDVKLGGPAMYAGLRRGDIITKVDARAISSTADLESALQAIKSPGKVSLEVIKKGKPTTIVIDLPSNRE